MCNRSHFKVGILIDEFKKIDIEADATIDIAKTGFLLGFDIQFFTRKTVFLDNGNPFALCMKIDNVNGGNKNDFFSKRQIIRELTDFNLILIRHDPPFDMSYLTCCYILRKISEQVIILNDPSALILYPEKILPTYFADIHPPTLISSCIKQLNKFREEHKDIILKPIYNFRGKNVFHISEGNENFISTVETLLDLYDHPIIIQKYIKEVRDGDKRIFLLNGEPVGAINRIPKENDARSNIYAGGYAKPYELSRNDKQICSKLSGFLRENKMVLVGIDIIGDYLTEINGTSPTGIVQIKKLTGIDISKLFWIYLEELINMRKINA